MEKDQRFPTEGKYEGWPIPAGQAYYAILMDDGSIIFDAAACHHIDVIDRFCLDEEHMTAGGWISAIGFRDGSDTVPALKSIGMDEWRRRKQESQSSGTIKQLL